MCGGGVCRDGDVNVRAFGASRRGAAPYLRPLPLSSLLMSPLETHPIPLIVMPWKRGEQRNL